MKRPGLSRAETASHLAVMHADESVRDRLFAAGLVIAWPRGDNLIRKVNDACDRAEFGAV
jgi:hypothetical protein